MPSPDTPRWTAKLEYNEIACRKFPRKRGVNVDHMLAHFLAELLASGRVLAMAERTAVCLRVSRSQLRNLPLKRCMDPKYAGSSEPLIIISPQGASPAMTGIKFEVRLEAVGAAFEKDLRVLESAMSGSAQRFGSAISL